METVSRSMASRDLSTNLFIGFYILSSAFHEYIHQMNLWEKGINLKSLLQNIFEVKISYSSYSYQAFNASSFGVCRLVCLRPASGLIFVMDSLGSTCRWRIIHRSEMGDTCKWQLNPRKRNPSSKIDSFQRTEQPDFIVIRNPMPLPALALTFPP